MNATLQMLYSSRDKSFEECVPKSESERNLEMYGQESIENHIPEPDAEPGRESRDVGEPKGENDVQPKHGAGEWRQGNLFE